MVTATIVSSLSAAIKLAQQLKEVGDKIKDAEFRNLTADLYLKLADVKMQFAEVLEENTELKKKVRVLESTEGDPCPRCRKRTWGIVSNRPDRDFGDMGVFIRTYKCSACDYSEDEVVSPK